ncbi:MAG: filamentous hemagglutinin N-terminal protein, partial [Polaromonas sp.]|nr:filamentous hemagglutinin N-terminal protein [Polaromonas sp.]
TAASGGYLALLAPEVRNEGVMVASLGTALLAAGNKVTLNLDNGSLLGYSIDQGAINALAENKQLIKADGGQVLLSAKALDSLTTATVNNTGVIEARTIQSKAGRILLVGDMAYGTVNVGGTLDASAPNGGDGGFIETSAANVNVAAGTRVTTKAADGHSGTWLIDPVDFTIAAGGAAQTLSGMGADVLSAALDGGNVSISTSATTAGTGDIHLNSAVSWSASPSTLTLTAHRDINFNAAVTYSGSGAAGLMAQAGRNIAVDAGVAIASTGTGSLSTVFNSMRTGTFGAITMAAGSSITSNGGNITFGGGADPAVGFATSQLDNGIDLNGASLISGAGNISLRGKGGSQGIYLRNGAQLSSTTGSITLVGTGNTVANSGTGVVLNGAATTISTVDGTITVTGTGTGTAGYDGVSIGSSSITASGAGSIAISGTGGAQGSGISMYNSSSGAPLIQTAGGNITLIAQSGIDRSTQAALNIDVGAVRSTGAGNVTLLGIGAASNNGPSNGTSVGYQVAVTSNGGNVSVRGTAGAGISASDGVLFGGSGRVATTGTGNVEVVGIGGTGVGGGKGIDTGIYTMIEAAGGNMLVSGTSSGAGSTSHGLYAPTLTVRNTGTGSIRIVGNATQTSVTDSARPAGISNWYAAGGNSIIGGPGYAGDITVVASASPDLAGASFNSVPITTTGHITFEGARPDVAVTVQTDFTAPATQGDSFQISGRTLSSVTPGHGGFTFGTSTSTAPLTVAGPSSFTAPVTLKSGSGGIAINNSITSTSSLTVEATGGAITAPASINVAMYRQLAGTFSQVASALPTFSATDFRVDRGTFMRALGGDGTIGNAYLLTDVYGLQGAGSAGMLDRNFKLANSIDASGTAAWSGGAGFKPIGDAITNYSGIFEGDNKTINNLTINRPAQNAVGLFGELGSAATVQNVGLTNVSVTGKDGVGGLAGVSIDGQIGNSYATGSVMGQDDVGGLVGLNAFGLISNSYATSSATGRIGVGGLTGYSGGLISNSYATGGVTGSSSFGGLVGLVNGGTISDSFWDTQTSGQTVSAGGTGGTTAQMKQASTFSTWSIATTGGSTNVWRIYEGNTGPLLRSFMTGLSLADTITTYDGSTQTGATTAAAGVLGTAASERNAATYLSGYYSGQQGVDISGGTLTINKADVTLSSSDVTKTYDGGLSAGGATIVTAGTIFAGDSATGGTFAFTDKNVGNGTKTVTASAVTVGDGVNHANYNISYADNTTSTINQADLTLTTSNVTTTYDGALSASGTVSVTSGAIFLGDSASGGAFAFTDKNFGAGNKTVSISGVTVGDGVNNANYNITYASNTTSTINKADLTVTASAVAKTYDGTVAASGAGTLAALAGVAAGEMVDSSGAQAFLDKNAGTGNKTVRASGVTIKDSGNADVTGNYNITYADNSTSTINKADVTLVAVTDTKTYDGTAASSMAVIKTGLVGGDTVTAIQVFGSKNVMGSGGSTLSVDAGYTLNDGNGGGNYNVTTTTAAGPINKASLTLVAIADTKIYDGTAASMAAVSKTGLVGGDTVTAVQSFGSRNVLGAGGSTLSVDAGYSLNDGNSGGNYNVTATTAAGTINKAGLTLAAVTDSKTYDGTAASTVSVNTVGLFGRDSVTAGQSFGSKNVMGANGSTLAVDAGYVVADGNSGGNYNVTTATAAGTIHKASLILAAVTDTRTYDGTAASTVAVLKTGLVGGDTATAAQSFGSKSVLGAGGSTLAVDAGYVVADGNSGGNYNVTTATAAGTINKAGLTLEAVTDSKTYEGTRNSSVAVNTVGLFGGDSVTAGQSFGTKNVMGSGGSTLSVDSGYTVADGNSGGNYSVTTTTAPGTINKATLNLTATPDNKVYDGTTVATASYADNRITGDVLSYSAVVAFADKNVANGIAVSVGGITTSGTDAGNYTVGSATVVGNTADITPKALTVTANDDTKQAGTPYSGGNGVRYDGLVTGETAAAVLTGNVAYGGGSQGATLAGSYDITPGGLVANGNYRLNFMEGTLTLTGGDAASAALGGPARVDAYTSALSAVASMTSGSGGGESGGFSGGGSGGGNSPNAAGNALNAAASDSDGDTGDR